VTEGQFPSRTCGLGAETQGVLRVIAHQHPEAVPSLIADAYDAFDRDETSPEWRTSARSPIC
jgi:hypothetical protein